LRFALLLHFEYPFIGLLHFQGKNTRLIVVPKGHCMIGAWEGTLLYEWVHIWWFHELNDGWHLCVGGRCYWDSA